MQRNTFLKSCLAIGTLASVPFNLMAKGLSRFRVNSGFMVDATKSRSGKAVTLLEGDTFMTKVATADK